MSRAFVKEDVDPPERSGRARSASGLPPGAANYITARGAERLRARLVSLRRAEEREADKIAHLEQALGSVTIVQPPEDPDGNIAFGARVTVRDAAGQLTTHRIVGVDELELYDDSISWISPNGKALLAAELGDRVVLENDARVEVVKVEYPRD